MSVRSSACAFFVYRPHFSFCVSSLLFRMDVIALRKGSGNNSGDILLNGYPQESISFRRCSGYVEQFGEK